MNEQTAKELLAKVVEDYDSISDEFDQTRKHDWAEFREFLNYLKNDDAIADIGCGNGRLYKFLSENLKDFHYIGIDKSSKLIEKAKINFQADFKIGDLLDIPLQSSTQDAATCIAALHHIPSKKLRVKAFNELHRILKKDGILILSNWNLFQPKYKKYIWKARLKSLLTLGKYSARDTFIPWGKTGINRYYYAFKPQELNQLIKNSGFKILDQQINRNIVIICQKA